MPRWRRSRPASASSAGRCRCWSMARTASSPGMAGCWRRRKLGLERVPVIELAHMSEAQKRAYVLADNQLALNAGWDEALLRLELADLSELGFDLGLIGFGEGELERLLAGEQGGPDRGRRGAGAARAGGHHAGRSVGAGRAPAALRRRHGAGRRRAGAGRAARRHDLHRSAVQRGLRQLAQGQAARQAPADPERQSRQRLRGVPARRLRQHPAA